MALAVAQFALLISAARRNPAAHRLLGATIAVGSLLAGLLIVVVLGWEPTDLGGRLIGVVAILDVLGAVVTMALGVFGGRRPQAPGPRAAQASGTMTPQ